MKTSLWSAAAIAIFIGLFAKHSLNQQGDIDLLIHFAKSSGVSIQKIVLTSSHLFGKALRMEHILHLKTKAGCVFSIKLNKQDHPKDHDMIEYDGQKYLSQGVVLKIKVVGQETNKEHYRTYLLAKLVSQRSKRKQVNQYDAAITRSLKELGFDPKIKISIQGTLDQKMNHQQQHEWILSMFKKLDGKVTEGLNEKNVISLTGYSQKLHGAVMSKNQKVNLQIASRYNPLTEKTEITIGTPVIMVEY